MNTNKKSLYKGIGVTVLLCGLWIGLWIIIANKNFTLLAGGMMFIVLAIGISGYFTTPIQHRAVKKVLEKREMDEEKQFEEGPGWLAPWQNVETESAQEWIYDVPDFKALTKSSTKEKKGVEMITRIRVRLRVKNPAVFFNLKNARTAIVDLINSRCEEANFEYITNRTYLQCRKAQGEIQEKIKERMQELDENGDDILSKYGIEILEIDIQSVMPRDDILERLAKDKMEEIEVDRFTTTMKEIQLATDGEIDPKALMDKSLVLLGKVKQEIKANKLSFDFGPDTLEAGKSLAKGAGEFFIKTLLKKKGDQDE